jgi:hypothetical protein
LPLRVIVVVAADPIGVVIAYEAKQSPADVALVASGLRGREPPMACSVPIYYLLHREAADGSEGMLMEPDLASALDDAVSDPAWRPVRITFGRQIVLEGEALATAIAERDGT